MYVNAFVCGVFVTLFTEMALLIVGVIACGIVSAAKKKTKGGKRYNG